MYQCERFASVLVSVVDPDRHLRQFAVLSTSYPRERQFYTGFFSELNPFKFVSIIIHVMSLATPSTLYYIVILAFTAFLV